MVGDEFVEIGIGEHAPYVLFAVAERHVTERTGLNVTIERFGRAAELGRRFLFREQAVGRADAGLALAARLCGCGIEAERRPGLGDLAGVVLLYRARSIGAEQRPACARLEDRGNAPAPVARTRRKQDVDVEIVVKERIHRRHGIGVGDHAPRCRDSTLGPTFFASPATASRNFPRRRHAVIPLRG